MNSRRDFVRSCALLLTAFAAAPRGLRAGVFGVGMKECSLNDLSFALFESQVNTHFEVAATPGRTMPLALIKTLRLIPSPPPGASSGWECFSLVFQGSGDQPIAQDTYRFSHPELGRFDLFIVPVACEAAGVRHYQAILNRPAVVPAGSLT